MATGVTSASPYAAAPPPPPINPIAGAGGSRKNKHIVGGSTSNVAYTPGANLLAARQGYQQNLGSSQNAMQRGFFQGQAQQAPDFSAVATNSMQQGQGLTQGQAVGNTLNQHSLGQVRPTNAPVGLGFGRSNALGFVRQHTLTGNEATDSGMTYTPTAAPPPPPPPTPTVIPTEPGTNPGPNATPTQMLDYSQNTSHAYSEIMAGRYDAFLNHPDPAIKQLAVNAKKAADLAREQANSTQYNNQTTSSGGAGWHHVTPTTTPPPAPTAINPQTGAPVAGTPAPVPTMTMQQAVAAWGNKPRTYKHSDGSTRRTAAWTAFLQSKGLL